MATLPTSEGLEYYKVYYVAAALIVIWLCQKLLSPSPRLPPSPPALPVLGHLHLLGTHPHISMANLAKKYGPLMSLRLGQRQYIVASSPETAKELLKHQDANFCSRPDKSCGKHLMYNNQDIGFQAYNANFRHLRKIFMTELVNAHRLQDHQRAREDEMAYMVNAIYQKCSQGEVQVKAHLHVTMLNIISHMVLNKRFAGDFAETEKGAIHFRELLEEHFRLCGVMVLGDFIPALKWLDFQGFEARMQTSGPKLDALASKMVAEHRERRKQAPVPEQNPDIVDILLEKQEAINETQTRTRTLISEDQVKAVLLDTFVGGTGTTIVTSEWAMVELVRHPPVIAKAQAELDRVVGRQRKVQESDIAKLPYLQAIVKETFRLHPPGPLLIPHESLAATTVFQYDIPAKTGLFVNVWAMGRDPSVWEHPLVFDPERFLHGKGADLDARGQHFELLPFGSGRRMCPAMNLGSTMVHFAIASLVQAFVWSIPGGGELDMADEFGLVVPIAAPLQAMVEPRLPQHLYHYEKA